MQRKYRLGDGLLTTTDLEAMNKEDFTTIGAFVQEFKKRARKVHGISEEAQCAIFPGLLTASEAIELTKHGGGSTKFTWATIDRGVEVGCLDQVEQRQVRLQRHKRKERDATASGTPGVTRIVTDVLAQLGYPTEPVVQRRVVTAVKVKGKEPVIEEAGQEELWEEEEPVPQHLTKVQRKVSQGSVVGGGNQGQGNQGNGGKGGGKGRGRNDGGRGRQWNGQGQGYQGQGSQGQGYQGQGSQGQGYQGQGSQGQGYQGQGSQGQGYQGQGYQGKGYQGQGDQGSQRYGRPRFDWRTAICQHCDQQGHTIRFCNIRREDERSGLISSTMDGDIYDQFGEAIDRRLGGVRVEAQRRVAAGPPPPAMFRLWQEKEEPLFRVEEMGSNEEVTQWLRGGSETEETIIIESDDKEEEERTESPSVLFEKMKDLLDKMGRYRQKLVGLCKEVKGWRSNIPTIFLYDSGPESSPGRPGVNVVGSCPQAGIRGRPLTPQARLAQAARTRNRAKASTSQEPPRGEHEPGRRKEAVEVTGDDDEEEEDERLRGEEDQRAEQRARKKGIRGEAEPVIQDGPPKKKKYAVRLEEGFDVEKVIDRLLEGHNDLMTMKEILANRPNPGSFTIEESEGERRRLWAEPEVGERVEAFSLSLSDVGKAMDLVAAHEMADPDAIQALREQVLECPEAGRLKLVYRLPGIGGNPVSVQTQSEGEAVENTPLVDGFLDQEEDVRLHINKWSPRAPSCVGYPIWQAPKGYERRNDLVLKPFKEEDPWGGKDVQWMMELALASSHSLVEDMRTIEEGPGQIERHEDLMGGMYLLVSTLLQEGLDQSGSLNSTGNVDEVSESQDDEFEEGEIKETFRAEEYDGIYLELGLLLSCEMRLRDASDRAQRMLQRYLVRDGHLFVRREVGNPRRVVCGRNRQIDVVAALHDGIAGGHRGVQATYAKISELYYWDGMMDMVGKFCRSCVPCQERSRLRQREPLHPRLEREVGAVVHFDLLFMPLGDQGYNYIFDARDNLSGFVDGRAIRTKTGSVLVSCIEEYYLRYPFVREFVMDRGSEFTC
ncbi:hypothetical protein CBR_g23705 [Chara braunii]|uniref:Integrase zinc-binding domain-containing protein n=1 Tax=Chara braunii TaxID=69332 RepID=A0A388L4Z5_CHABU|nr:hypothetical protein CBR_g23705 [Chara braunii]|eukprot:GBG77374.1 hypothetical protein CBR_g23705 [Chara braunii]